MHIFMISVPMCMCVILCSLHGMFIILNGYQGRIQDFHLGGGGGGLCAQKDYERGTELTFGRGPGPAYGLWKLWGYFNALSCNLSLIFKHSDKKLD